MLLLYTVGYSSCFVAQALIQGTFKSYYNRNNDEESYLFSIRVTKFILFAIMLVVQLFFARLSIGEIKSYGFQQWKKDPENKINFAEPFFFVIHQLLLLRREF